LRCTSERSAPKRREATRWAYVSAARTTSVSRDVRESGAPRPHQTVESMTIEPSRWGAPLGGHPTRGYVWRPICTSRNDMSSTNRRDMAQPYDSRAQHHLSPRCSLNRATAGITQGRSSHKEARSSVKLRTKRARTSPAASLLSATHHDVSRRVSTCRRHQRMIRRHPHPRSNESVAVSPWPTATYLGMR
jgi:hypothetical protein